MTAILIQQLRQDPSLREALDAPFDFTVTPPDYDISWFTIEPAGRVEPIACDSTGGVFVVYGPAQLLIHVTSEGQAGVVARDLREFLTILVTYPYWFDLLMFSGGGQLEEMKSAIQALEENQAGRRAHRFERHRRLVMEKLGLRSDPDAVTLLHAAVAHLGRDLRILAPDGSVYDSLFNRYPAARLRPPRPVP